MTSGSRAFGRKPKYGLTDLLPGETKTFHDASANDQILIRRSAHNYNVRGDMHFVTRTLDGIMMVKRVR